MNVVKNKIEGFTEKQVKRSQEARQIYCRIGEPAVENMKMIIRQNLIKNFPVTTRDVHLDNRTFGPDISMLKGIFTRAKPVQVIDYLIEMPKELIISNQLLYLDIGVMFINTQPMFTTNDRSIQYICLVPLDDKIAEEIYCVLGNVIRHYKRAGFL